MDTIDDGTDQRRNRAADRERNTDRGGRSNRRDQQDLVEGAGVAATDELGDLGALLRRGGREQPARAAAGDRRGDLGAVPGGL